MKKQRKTFSFLNSTTNNALYMSDINVKNGIIKTLTNIPAKINTDFIWSLPTVRSKPDILFQANAQSLQSHFTGTLKCNDSIEEAEVLTV